MKTLKFRYAGAWNFLPFGPEGVEFYFDDYGQVVLITGENLDTGTEKNPANNGVGKSSIFEILSYAIYGKTVKCPKKLDHGMIINKISGSKLLVDVQFDDYRIVRGRKPDKLNVWCSKDHIWDDTTKVSKGKGIQEYIEGIVGLSHLAFCNVVVFDDSNDYSFLELDAPHKREVVENLLGLDRYRLYHEAAKVTVKELKTQIRDYTNELEYIQQSIKESDVHITKIEGQQASWTRTKQAEVEALRSKLLDKQDVLATYDSSVALTQYNTAHQKAAELALSVDDLKEKKAKNIAAQQDARGKLNAIRETLRDLEENLQKHRLEYQRLRTETAEAQKVIAKLKSLQEGAICPTCNGKVDKENYASLLLNQQNVMTSSEIGYRREEAICKEASEKVEQRKLSVDKIQKMIGESEKRDAFADAKINEETKEMNRLSGIPKPTMGEQERVLEAEIVAIKKQIEEKQGEINGISPYKEILEHAQVEQIAKVDKSKVKAEELVAVEKLLPYREWWVYAFGDKGIRRHLIDKIIPALNSRLAYWLQFLTDSKLTLSFDNELKETITRTGTSADYHPMSNGEKRKINLAVSQAFAYVMMLNSGYCPSVVFLDEITGGGIDSAGVTGVYNMIYELAKERQVFVTTHNQGLLRMLDGCESIKLIKSGDVTTLAK